MSTLIKGLRLSILGSITVSLVSFPPANIFGLNIRLFDLMVFFMGAIIIVHLVKTELVQFPKPPIPFLALFAYSIVISTMALVGVAIYNYPLSYAGSIRWLFVVLLVLSLYQTYFHEENFSLIQDLKKIFVIILGVYVIVFLGQFAEYLGLMNFGEVMEYWYQGRKRDGDLGESWYGNRFSGPEPRIGSAGFTLAVITLGLFSMWYDELDIGTALMVIVSIGLLIATGLRSVLIPTIGIIAVLLLFKVISDNVVNWLRVAVTSLIVFPILALIYRFDIAGIGTSPERYYEPIYIITGRKSWTEVSGRDVDRWIEQAHMIQAEHTIGTLAHPQRVMDLFLDSYYILAYYQGGIILLTLYIIVVSAAFVYSIKRIGEIDGKMAFCISSIVIAISFTQTLSGIRQMVLIGIVIGLVTIQKPIFED